MATVTLTNDTFADTVTNNELVFVDFWAEWCGPCRMFAPVYEKLAEENSDIVFGKVDTEAQEQLAAEFNIMSIPTLMIFKDQTVVFAQPGALGEHSLRELIGKARELDMAEVRRSA
jgi:thioredoxin 1